MSAIVKWWENPDRDNPETWPDHEQLAKLFNLPRWRAIKIYLIAHGVMTEGASEYIGKQLAGEILSDPRGWEKKAHDWKCEQDQLKAEADRLKAEVMEREEAKREKAKRIRNLLNDFGYCDFDEYTSKFSPRPKQFEFVATFFSEDQSGIRQTIQDQREDTFGTSYRGLFLYGPSQVTKSASAWLAAKTYIKEYTESAKFVETTPFARLASQSSSDRDLVEKFNELVDECLDVPLLILDDIGTEDTTSKVYESAIYQILEERRKHDDRWTIITSNFSPEALCKRMFSDANKEKILARFKNYFLPVNFDHAG